MKIASEKINPFSEELYKYLNFDQLTNFEDEGRIVSKETEAKILLTN